MPQKEGEMAVLHFPAHRIGRFSLFWEPAKEGVKVDPDSRPNVQGWSGPLPSSGRGRRAGTPPTSEGLPIDPWGALDLSDALTLATCLPHSLTTHFFKVIDCR